MLIYHIDITYAIWLVLASLNFFHSLHVAIVAEKTMGKKDTIFSLTTFSTFFVTVFVVGCYHDNFNFRCANKFTTWIRFFTISPLLGMYWWCFVVFITVFVANKIKYKLFFALFCDFSLPIHHYIFNCRLCLHFTASHSIFFFHWSEDYWRQFSGKIYDHHREFWFFFLLSWEQKKWWYFS